MSDASCRLLSVFFDMLAEHDVTPEQLTAGTRIDPEYIQVPHHWIPWDDFRLLTERTAEIVGGNDNLRDRAEELLFASDGIAALTRVSRAFSGPKVLYRANARWIAGQLLGVATWTYADAGRDRCVTSITIEGHEIFPAFISMYEAVMRGMPSILGLPHSTVTSEMSEDRRTVHYTVQVPPSYSLLARLGRWLWTPFSSVAIVQELEAQSRSLELRVRQIATARSEAHAASALRSTFLSTIGHELRTPLNGVVGTVELLLDMHATSEQRELLLANQGSALRLQVLIHKVLEFSRLASDDFTVDERPFSPRDLLHQVAQEANASQPDGPQVRVQLTGEGGTRASDPDGIRSILSALVDNAQRHAAPTQVVLHGHLEGQVWTLRVRDDGIGMSPAELDRLFQPLSQGDVGLNRKDNTIGLSNAIAQRRVHVMGGTIHADSAPGSGTTVTIILPVGPAARSRQHQEPPRRPAPRAIRTGSR